MSTQNHELGNVGGPRTPPGFFGVLRRQALPETAVLTKSHPTRTADLRMVQRPALPMSARLWNVSTSALTPAGGEIGWIRDPAFQFLVNARSGALQDLVINTSAMITNLQRGASYTVQFRVAAANPPAADEVANVAGVRLLAVLNGQEMIRLGTRRSHAGHHFLESTDHPTFVDIEAEATFRATSSFAAIRYQVVVDRSAKEGSAADQVRICPPILLRQV